MSVYVNLGDDGRWVDGGYLTSDGLELDFSGVDEPAHSSRGFSIDRMRGFVFDAQDYAVRVWRRRVAQRREVLQSYLAAVERHEAREAEQLREVVRYEADCDARATDPIMHELMAQRDAYLRETLAAVGVPVYSIESDGYTVHITYEPPRPLLPDIRPAIEALWRDFDHAASLPLPGINGAAGVEHYRAARAVRSASAATAQRLRSILDSRES